jgi:putative ABC transport system permease protein
VLFRSRVARKRDLHPGEFMYSSPEQVFDLAGAYPLKMRITGVLGESHSADDDAVFVDVKTSWLMAGIAHGHEDVVKNSDPKSVLEKRDDNVAVTNAVRMFTEVTEENMASFHFHGDPESFPLTAILCVPNDEKSRVILLGKFQNSTNSTQLVRPTEQMDALLTALFQARELALVLLAVLGIAVILIAALVFALSFKMRRREFATLEEIGLARSTLALVKIFEIVIVGILAGAIVLGLTALIDAWGVDLLRMALR